MLFHEKFGLSFYAGLCVDLMIFFSALLSLLTLSSIALNYLSMNRSFLKLVMISLFVDASIAEIIPVDNFFQNPTIRSFNISPDGKTIAGLAPYEGVMNVFILDMETRRPRILTGQKRDVTSFYWVNNERIFYSVNTGEATNDARRYGGAIYGINIDGSDHELLVKPWLERRQGFGEIMKRSINVISVLRNDPKYVLVQNNDRREAYPDLFLMNVQNGNLKKLRNNPGELTSYFLDPDGEVIGGLWWENLEDPTTAAIFRRNVETDEWSESMKVNTIFDMPEFVGLNSKKDRILVSKRGEDGMKRLYSISLEKEGGEKLLLEDETYDITDFTVLRNMKSLGIAGIRFDKEKPTNVFFDKMYERLYAMIDDAIPDSSNYISDFDDSGTKLIIHSISDRHSPQYFLLDLKAGAMEPLGDIFPNLAQVYLPEQRPIEYEANDGYTIHGYLYLPEGYKDGDKVPLIVNPHGGPWGRDKWGIRWWFDLEPIYLVNRGFAVLKTNFRASTGYGKEHEKASYKDWDRTMQDIWDGVNWAIDAGYADKDNIGVVGASFGGTATMLSLVHHPEMFQFGINFFGVVDVPEQIRTYYQWDRDLAGDAWKQQVGDPDVPEELEKIERWSAINYVEKIDDPLFLYHGLVDRNVDVEQTRALVGKLKSVGKKEGKDYWIEWDTDEAHGAYNAEKRIQLYKKIDEFLKPFAPVYN